MTDKNYDEDLNNPLAISKCEEKANSTKIKSFINKKMISKINDIKQINSEIDFDWEELLDKLLNSKSSINDELIEKITEMAAQQRVITRALNKVISISKDL